MFWRVVGTRSDKTLVISDTLSVLIDTPQPVGNPTITNTSKSSLPILSWENNCNFRSKVWFGNNPFFTHQTSVSFDVKDPTENGGVFTESLTSGQWTADAMIRSPCTDRALADSLASQAIVRIGDRCAQARRVSTLR